MRRRRQEEDFQKLLTDLQPLIKDEKIIVVGGVNEPSHLDWNIEAIRFKFWIRS